MSLVIPSYFAPSFGGDSPVIVQSAIGEGAQASLSGVTPGNLILGLGASEDSYNSGSVSFSGFSATFSEDGNTANPSVIIRAGLATGTTATFDYSRNIHINIIVEISGATVTGMAAAQQSHDVFQTDVPVDGPSLAGFAAGDLVVGFAGSRDGRGFVSTGNLDSGVFLIREGSETGTTTEVDAAAVWKVASAGTNDMPNIFGGGISEDWRAYTIRIPKA